MFSSTNCLQLLQYLPFRSRHSRHQCHVQLNRSCSASVTLREPLSKWKVTASYWSLTPTTHSVEAARDKKSPIILQTSQVRRQVEAYLRLE